MSGAARDHGLSASLALERRVLMLRTAMGPDIAKALNDPDVVEVMLNPDGSLWVDRLGSGREPLGVSLTPADGERIIRLVAAHVGAEVHARKPLLSAELPETGERFEGALPPVTPGPVFALRKRAVGLIRLDAYVADGMNPDRVRPIVQVAVARFREFQALKNELQKTRDQLADRKLIDKAKGLLMKHRNFNEDEAYHAMRKLAMERNQRLVDTARNVIEVFEMLGGGGL